MGTEGTTLRYDGSVSFANVSRYMETLSASQWQEAFMIGLKNANTYKGTAYSLNMADHFTDSRIILTQMVKHYIIPIGQKRSYTYSCFSQSSVEYPTIN